MQIMVALLLIVVFGSIAAALGRAFVDVLGVPALPPMERLAYAGLLGLGITAYGVYGLGLAGLLSFWPVTCWWLALTFAGWRGWRAFGSDFRAWHSRRKPTAHRDIEYRLSVACGVFLLIFGLVALVACFRPPGPLEWDALSYHLADPKLFLLQHRIPTLPTEHHSNFPFTVEMLFTVGLLYNGYALANLFHLLLAVLLTFGMIGFCSRMSRPVVGWLASVVFVTTPMVLWECSVAYIDVGLAAYTTLAAFALVSGLGDRGQGTGDRRGESEGTSTLNPCVHPQGRTQPSTILLSAALMGFALGIKYLALVPFGLMTMILLVARVPVKRAGLFVAVACAIGSPWYVKNLAVMGNPVYPFVTKVFPHSRYWSLDRAAAYQTEQDKFGTKPLSPDARSKLLNALQIPWHLLTRPNAKSNVLYCNPGEYNFTALFGGLYAALVFPLAFLRRIPRHIRLLLWLALGQMLAWFVLSQVGRYVIQVMPLFAIVGAYAACQFAFATSSGIGREENGSQNGSQSGSGSGSQQNDMKGLKCYGMAQAPGLLGFAAIFGQAVYVLLSICILPMNAGLEERRGLAALGQMPSSVSVPTLLTNLAQPEAWDADLRRRFDAYNAIQWINGNTPARAGIALVDETRGFYLDRSYIWANQQHSSYIPYETLADGEKVTAWFGEHGIQYALINLNQAAQNNGAVRDSDFPNGPNGVEAAALQKWYVEGLTTASAGDRGHQLMGDALRRGLWTPVFNEHGCVVVRMQAAGKRKKENGKSEEDSSFLLPASSLSLSSGRHP